VWLGDRIWATHGHYLDRYLMPESAFGLLRFGPLGRRDGGTLPIDYERARVSRRRDRDTLLTRMLERPLATLLETVSELVRTTAMPALPQLLMNARLSGLTAATIDFQMRHATIPAMARVVRQLGVEADWIVFGHVHRLGPLAGERVDRWRAASGSPRLVNTGSWLYEPSLIDRARPPHPYWPGGAVVIETGDEPRAIGLLNDLEARQLKARGAPPSIPQDV
jgi:hypothetical protein